MDAPKEITDEYYQTLHNAGIPVAHRGSTMLGFRDGFYAASRKQREMMLHDIDNYKNELVEGNIPIFRHQFRVKGFKAGWEAYVKLTEA